MKPCGEKGLWRDKAPGQRHKGERRYPPCGVPGSGSALVGNAATRRSRGSGHWGRHGIQPCWSRDQAAPGAPARGSLTCRPSMRGTSLCRTSIVRLCTEQGLSSPGWHMAPEPSDPQQPPSAGLGWGCLVRGKQAGGEGTGTLPELLLYK